MECLIKRSASMVHTLTRPPSVTLSILCKEAMLTACLALLVALVEVHPRQPPRHPVLMATGVTLRTRRPERSVNTPALQATRALD